ncbi:MAG TPA: ankyrin repeat domain-containing protein, partial [Gammaproteobacteria bacterium]|nr:ankyrin repeat domain-containing protein [Gammaproteobacteria bacterium]
MTLKDVFDGVTALVLAPFYVTFLALQATYNFMGSFIAGAYNILSSLNAPRYNLLAYAVRKDYPKVAKAALFTGADPNAADTQTGDTFLHNAQSKEMATVLKNNGARIIANRQGNTPLHLAMIKPNAQELATILLEMPNADINLQNIYGETPLHVACKNRALPPALTSLLLAKGANPNLITNINATGTGIPGGNTPLHLLLKSQSGYEAHRQLTPESVENAKLLVNAGTDLSKRNDEERTILDELQQTMDRTRYFGAYDMNVDKLAYAILKNNLVQPMQENAVMFFNNGAKLIHFIAAKCIVAALNLLSGARDSVDSPRDLMHRSPLEYATQTGTVEMVNHLLEKGATRIAEAFDVAESNDTPDKELIMETLYNKKPDGLVEQHSAYKYLTQICAGPLTNGKSPRDWYKQQGDLGNPPKATMLHFAAQYVYNADSFNDILNLINPDARDALGRTPLHYAVSSGNIMAVQALFAKGADVNATDAYGLPPLYYAAHVDGRETLSALFAAGANVNMEIPDPQCKHSGRSLLHFAAQFGSARAVQVLISRKADPNAKDKLYFKPAELQYIQIQPVDNQQAGTSGNRITHRLTAAPNNDVFNAHEHSGRTPLHYAVMGSKVENVK